MKIFKVADEKIAPNWYEIEELQPTSEVATSPQSEVKRINIASDVTEEVISQECDEIEKCASDGKIYHYNSNWDRTVVSHLKEFALASGMALDSFRPFDTSIIAEELKPLISRTASKVVVSKEDAEVEALKNVMGDPFHIEARSNMDHYKKSNWQEVRPESKLADAPSMDSGVRAARGGEDYFMNSLSQLPKNQNSIMAPDAIEKLAESTVETSGERLRRQKVEKEAARIANNKEWESDKIKAMESNDIVSKGLVFPTEVMNAQSGLNTPSSSRGVYSTFDPASIPDKTAGEKLAETNAAYKKSIQRPREETDWQKASAAANRSISSDFGAELESILKK